MNQRILSLVTVALVAILALAAPAGNALAQGQGETIATSFNAPLGVLVDAEGNIWVIDSGMGGETQLTATQGDQQATLTYGESARLVRIAPDGTQTVISTLPSLSTPEGAAGGAHLALLNGTLYVTSSEWLGGIEGERPTRAASILALRDSDLVQVADTWAFEERHNPDGNQLHSHPYGIEAGPKGNYLWVADAGSNSLLRFNPENGEVTLVAVFQALPTGLPDGQGPPASEAVPTGVAFGRDGAIYVSLLSGFPFLPGASKVVRVTPDGQVSDYATGLTMLTALETGPDGELYAVSIGRFSEQGPVPGAGQILRIREGGASEVVVDGLTFPSAIAFNPDGDAYVTLNIFGPPGAGSVVRFDGLTGLRGRALPSLGAASPAAPASPAAQGDQATGDTTAPEAQAAPDTQAAPQTLPVTGQAPLAAGWLLAGAGALVVAVSVTLRYRRVPVRRE